MIRLQRQVGSRSQAPLGNAAYRSSASRRVRVQRVRSRRAGAAAVEFAIVLPVLVTVLLGATDFGRFSYSAIAVANAARAGAAYGSMNSFSSSVSAWQTGIQNAVTDEMSNSSF